MNLDNYRTTISESLLEIMEEIEINGGELSDSTLDAIKQTIELLINNPDVDINRLLDVLVEDYVRINERLVENGFTPGIASSIDLLDGPAISVYRGYTSVSDDKKEINEKTRFDIASVTKLFTALMLEKEKELGNIDFNKTVKEIDSSFNLDVKLDELLRFYHEIRTNGRIDNASNEEEAIDLLKNAIVVRNGIHLYSDIPYMIASKLIDSPVYTFHKYFNEDLGLKSTGYNIYDDDICTGGNKENLNEVHDPKAKVVSYAGHAGVFTTTSDLNKLFEGLAKMTFVSKDSIRDLVRPIIEEDYVNQFVKKDENGNDVYRNEPIKRGILYKKHPKGLAVTEVLNEESDYAMAASGFTGSYINMDFENGISFNFLTNLISGNGKIKGYVYKMDELKKQQFDTAIKIKLVCKVYQKLYGTNELVHKKIKK